MSFSSPCWLRPLGRPSASSEKTSFTDSGSVSERKVNFPPWVNLSATLSALFVNFLVHEGGPRVITSEFSGYISDLRCCGSSPASLAVFRTETPQTTRKYRGQTVYERVVTSLAVLPLATEWKALGWGSCISLRTVGNIFAIR